RRQPIVRDRHDRPGRHRADRPGSNHDAAQGAAVPRNRCPGHGRRAFTRTSCWPRALTLEDAMNASTAGSSGQIVAAGAGYAGLPVALRLAAKLRNDPDAGLTLVDRHDYHQVLTELPRVAGGTRAAGAVRIPIQDVLAARVRFVQTEITGFDW